MSNILSTAKSLKNIPKPFFEVTRIRNLVHRRIGSVSMCVLTIFIVVGCGLNSAAAQSNFDVVAPVTSLYPAPDSGLPKYAMATAVKNKLQISTTKSVTRSDPDAGMEKEPRKYVIMVPYMEKTIVDGKKVVEEKFRVAHRTRAGLKSMKTTIEESNTLANWTDQSFQLIDGTELSIDEAKKRLASRTPVLMITEGETIHPFFRRIVKPDIVLIVTKKKEAKVRKK